MEMDIRYHKVLFITVILLASFLIFRFFFGYFSPFLIGFLIALLLEPAIRFLTQAKLGFRRGLASFLCLIAFAVAIGGIGVWVIGAVTREATEFLEAAPVFIDEMHQMLSAYPLYESTLANTVEGVGEWFKSQSIRAVGQMPEVLIGLILVWVSAYFFMKDREVIFERAASLGKRFPEWVRHYSQIVNERLKQAGIGFLKTELILALIVAALCVGVLWIIGSPYALMVGLMIALLDVLPILGSGIILWPWAAYLALTGEFMPAIWLLILFGAITLVRNALGPRILGDRIDLHPLAALMAIFIGIKVFGLAGIIAGPALVIVVKSIVKI